MPEDAPTYDLMLLLRADAAEEQRAELLADVESRIERGGGSLVGRYDWGVRQLAYEIRHRPDADYHLLQFRGPGELLESLHHSLKIADGVVRFRIIKLPPSLVGAPPARPERPPAEAA